MTLVEMLRRRVSARTIGLTGDLGLLEAALKALTGDDLVRCAGFYGDERAKTDPACGWVGRRSELRDGKVCPTCGAGHIVAVASTRQQRVAAWVVSTFGPETALDAPERTLRAAEEVIELAQACGVDAETIHRLVDYVFARPPGVPKQEIGGSMLTLYAAAQACGVDADEAYEAEMLRVELPEVVERCRRRQLEKREALLGDLALQPEVEGHGV